MMYNFSAFKARSQEIGEWLVKEFSTIRTGKASPLLLDSVVIESYGARQPIKHVASISVEDAKTLRITPWDKTHVKAIETAIAQANIGVSTSPDSNSIRVIFPDLTEERRKILLKLLREKLEEAKISVRKEREKVWNDIQDQEKAGQMSEDEKFRGKDDLQKLVDEINNKLESLSDTKEKEIMG